MSAEKIGRAKSGNGHFYNVYWDAQTHVVYVSYAGKSRCDAKAVSAAQAQRVAEAWLADK